MCIRDSQLSYVTHSGEGEGLLFYGNVILPFLDRFPKDTELYRIIDVYKRQRVFRSLSPPRFPFTETTASTFPTALTARKPRTTVKAAALSATSPRTAIRPSSSRMLSLPAPLSARAFHCSRALLMSTSPP